MYLNLNVDPYILLVYFTQRSVHIQMHFIGRKKLWKRSTSRLCTKLCCFLDQRLSLFYVWYSLSGKRFPDKLHR